MSRHASTTSPTSIVATLCDSRTCNQTGGGAHLQPDIEDFLRLAAPLVSAQQHDDYHDAQSQSKSQVTTKVSLTTCMGMCNRSPNMVLRTCGMGGVVGKPQGGKLKNDGGLRMMVDDDSDDDDESDDDDDASSEEHPVKVPTSRSNNNKIIINDVSIPKLARTIGFENGNLVRACDSKHKGRMSLVAGRCRDALRHFLMGRLWCQREEEKAGGDSLGEDLISATCQVQASLCLLCAKSRVQYTIDATAEITTASGRQERIQMLELAALEAFRVLDSSIKSDVSEIDDVLCGVVREVLDSAVGETIRSKLQSGLDVDVAFGDDGVEYDENIVFSRSDNNNSNGSERIAISSIHPRTIDPKVLTECCIILADAWADLSKHITSRETAIIAQCKRDNDREPIIVEEEELRASYAEGARISYKGVLAVAAAPSCKKLRLFRAKERRRIEKAVAGLC